MHPDWQSENLRYCELHSSPENSHLTGLTRYTWLHMINPRQLSGHLQGSFLRFLSQLLRPDTILEIGTFTGYASLCMADGLSAGGRLISLEADAETAFKAREAMKGHPKASQIEVINGNARDILPKLDLQAELIFVDADKQGYPAYLELCLPLLHPRGLMLFDNTLWSGKVLDEAEREQDSDTRNMHQFNVALAAREDLEVLLLPLRDGLTTVRKRD